MFYSLKNLKNKQYICHFYSISLSFLMITLTVHLWVATLRFWVNDINDLNPLWIPNTVFLQTAQHHAAVWRAPGSVVPVLMPGSLQWVTLVVYFFYSSNIDLHSNHSSLILRQMKWVSAGLVEISAEVDAMSKHAICRWLEATGHNLLYSISRGPMIHEIYLTIHRLL